MLKQDETELKVKKKKMNGWRGLWGDEDLHMMMMKMMIMMMEKSIEVNMNRVYEESL